MKQIKAAKRQITGLARAFLFVALVFSAAFAASGSSSLAGSWTGSYQTPGPAGSLEIILTNNENNWAGEVKIAGSKNRILTKPAQELKVEAEELSFTIEMMGAEIRFEGKLQEGKITGQLEAFEDGRKVGAGSWELVQAEK